MSCTHNHPHRHTYYCCRGVRNAWASTVWFLSPLMWPGPLSDLIYLQSPLIGMGLSVDLTRWPSHKALRAACQHYRRHDQHSLHMQRDHSEQGKNKSTLLITLFILFFFIFNEMHIDIYENIACAFQFITGVKAAVSSKKAAIQNTSFPSSGVICLYVGISGLVCAFAAPIWHLSECCCPFLSHVIGLVWLLVCTKDPGAPWSLSQQHSVCFENMALVFIFLGFISVLVSFISFGGSCGAFQCANVCLAQDVPFSLLGLACLFFLLIFIFNSQALKRDSDISKPGAYFNMSWCVLDSYSPKPLESVQ